MVFIVVYSIVRSMLNINSIFLLKAGILIIFN